MAYLTYSEKLLDPQWQRKRLEVLNRDQFKCCLCSDAKTTLHIHHKTYEKGKLPWEYELDNFQTLCKYCHIVVEFFKKRKEVVLVCTRKTYGINDICCEVFTYSQYFDWNSSYALSVNSDNTIEVHLETDGLQINQYLRLAALVESK